MYIHIYRDREPIPWLQIGRQLHLSIKDWSFSFSACVLKIVLRNIFSIHIIINAASENRTHTAERCTSYLIRYLPVFLIEKEKSPNYLCVYSLCSFFYFIFYFIIYQLFLSLYIACVWQQYLSFGTLGQFGKLLCNFTVVV